MGLMYLVHVLVIAITINVIVGVKMVFEYISLAADLAIIFLLFVQSYVLWVLKKPILETARNSEVYKKLFGLKDEKVNYPQDLRDAGILNCLDYNNPYHIHSKSCM